MKNVFVHRQIWRGVSGAWLPAMALALLAGAAAADPLIGALTGDTAAQAPLTTTDYGRFDTDLVDADTLAALANAQPLTGPLFATGGSVLITYVGTGAARDATLALADPAAPVASLSQSSQQLFATRDGCSYSDYLSDNFCLINTVGQSRSISNLSAGSALQFGLVAMPQAAGDPSVQSSSTQYLLAGSPGVAQGLLLSDGSLLLGFEDEGATDHADAIFIVQGVSFDAPVSDVPEPATATMALAGMAVLGWLKRRRHG